MDGLLRSLAKELRGGATGNGIVLADGARTTAPRRLGALRFFLSGRSAFVDGQFLAVGSAAGQLPADAEKPLAGKVAVVTGAARGIGAAIARTLHRDGATVVAVDVPAAGEQLAAVANEVRGTALQLDVTGARRRASGSSTTPWQRHGRLDIVVHNAGITRDKLLANMDAGPLGLRARGQHRRAAADQRGAAGLGALPDSPRIVSLASTSGIAGNRGQTNYAASKGGVIGMVRATAPLLGARGGTINAVAPGFIETEMTARIPFATREVARRLNSLQQGGQPVDVAETIAFLASDAAGGISGRGAARVRAEPGRRMSGSADRHPGRDARTVQALRQRGGRRRHGAGSWAPMAAAGLPGLHPRGPWREGRRRQPDRLPAPDRRDARAMSCPPASSMPWRSRWP